MTLFDGIASVERSLLRYHRRLGCRTMLSPLRLDTFILGALCLLEG